MINSGHPKQYPPGLRPYVIQVGDTLYKLAKQLNVPVKVIKSLNPIINPGKLTAGESLCIPVQGTYVPYLQGRYYIVVQNNSLCSISKFLNISLNVLMEVNPNIDPHTILVNEVICIPVGAPTACCIEGTTVYTIHPGDVLYLIAQKFNVTVEEVLRTNPTLNPNFLCVGQNICIPLKWELHFNERFNISFRYPADWWILEQEEGEPVRCEGEEGFFEIVSIPISADKSVEIKPVEDVCRAYIDKGSEVFGTNPQLEKTTIDGQEACFILPTNEQDYEKRGIAALIIRYPKVIYVSEVPCGYVMLYSEDNYIKALASTMKFVKK
jgi:LysM repeat protein